MQYHFSGCNKKLYCTKQNVIFILYACCVFKKINLSSVFKKTDLELRCAPYMYICTYCVCNHILVENVYNALK